MSENSCDFPSLQMFLTAVGLYNYSFIINWLCVSKNITTYLFQQFWKKIVLSKYLDKIELKLKYYLIHISSIFFKNINLNRFFHDFILIRSGWSLNKRTWTTLRFRIVKQKHLTLLTLALISVDLRKLSHSASSDQSLPLPFCPYKVSVFEIEYPTKVIYPKY